MLMRPAKCEAKAKANHHEAEAKKIVRPNSVRLRPRPEMPY